MFHDSVIERQNVGRDQLILNFSVETRKRYTVECYMLNGGSWAYLMIVSCLRAREDLARQATALTCRPTLLYSVHGPIVLDGRSLESILTLS